MSLINELVKMLVRVENIVRKSLYWDCPWLSFVVLFKFPRFKSEMPKGSKWTELFSRVQGR